MYKTYWVYLISLLIIIVGLPIEKNQNHTTIKAMVWILLPQVSYLRECEAEGLNTINKDASHEQGLSPRSVNANGHQEAALQLIPQRVVFDYKYRLTNQSVLISE